jgi:hypothetical protein
MYMIYGLQMGMSVALLGMLDRGGLAPSHVVVQ